MDISPGSLQCEGKGWQLFFPWDLSTAKRGWDEWNHNSLVPPMWEEEMSIISLVSFIRRETNFCMIKRVPPWRWSIKISWAPSVRLIRAPFFRKSRPLSGGFSASQELFLRDYGIHRWYPIPNSVNFSLFHPPMDKLRLECFLSN